MTFREYVEETLNLKNLKKGEFHKWCLKQGMIKSLDDEIPDECIEKGLKSDDPHVRKMANFARNAKKWKK